MTKIRDLNLSSEIITNDDFAKDTLLSSDLNAETTGLVEICEYINKIKNILRGTACLAVCLLSLNSYSATSFDSAKLKDLIGNDYIVTNIVGLGTLAEKEMVTKVSVSDIADPAYTNSIAWKVAHMYSGEGGLVNENDPVWLDWKTRNWIELGWSASVSNKSEGVAIGKKHTLDPKTMELQLVLEQLPTETWHLPLEQVV